MSSQIAFVGFSVGCAYTVRAVSGKMEACAVSRSGHRTLADCYSWSMPHVVLDGKGRVLVIRKFLEKYGLGEAIVPFIDKRGSMYPAGMWALDEVARVD